MEEAFSRSEVEEKLADSGKFSKEEVEKILDTVFGAQESAADSGPGDGDGDPPPDGNGGH